ncbi:MAG: Gx transporter family protein [Firmicutes bacterium]|nr:Gx transporter family protein [Bacillota bacterium]
MNAKKITYNALYLAIALAIFTIEAQLPPIVPIPGIKPGLSNIVILVCMIRQGRPSAFSVLLLRIILSSFFGGQFVSFAYSLSGGMLSFCLMSVLTTLFNKNTEKIWIISVFGAIAHNFGQVVCACIIMETPQIISYMSILTVSAVITGIFTGFSAMYLLKRIKRGT